MPDIRKLGRDIYRAIDCHSEGRSTVITAECMEPLVSETPDKTSPPKAQQRRIIRTLPPAMISGTVPPNVRADEWILSYTALGKVSKPLLRDILPPTRLFSNPRKIDLLIYAPHSLSGSFSNTTQLQNKTTKPHPPT